MHEEHERVKNAASGSDEISQEKKANTASSIHQLTANPQSTDTLTSNKAKGRNPNLKGGATMNVKHALQHNLNVNWAETTHNSLLFLFFRYFGGRNSFSRIFLLLSSPLCFFVQTRPVKVSMKQLFYMMGEPPGIALSLLPAQQQRIMSLDYGAVMRGLYGEKVLLKSLLNKSEEGKEEWMEMEQMEGEGEGVIVPVVMLVMMKMKMISMMMKMISMMMKMISMIWMMSIRISWHIHCTLTNIKTEAVVG